MSMMVSFCRDSLPSGAFRHNPYAVDLLTPDCHYTAHQWCTDDLSGSFPSGKTVALVTPEDGMSENDSVRTSPVLSPALPSTSVRPAVRYASVNFRFGSTWFVAPFRTQVNDMVVVQYPGNNNGIHIGLVSSITTVKPATLYTEGNSDPNYLSPEEIASVPHLLRHAREFDKEAKLDLRQHDLRALQSARELGKQKNAPVTFLDAEWLLDLTAVTFLVHVWDNDSVVDELVDALAHLEGAEVVFTYPSQV